MWVPQTASNCNGQGFENATVTLGFASFTFGSITNLLLCYKFGQNNFILYSGVSLQVKTTPVTASVDLVVLNVDTTITFRGAGVSSADLAEWVLPSHTVQNCGQNSMGNLQIVAAVGSLFGATFRFVVSEAAWQLCYKFGSNAWILVPGVSLASVGITGVSNPNNGGGAIAVLGQDQPVIISGIGISFGDQAKFVRPGQLCSTAGNEA
jgi:hypothetical protein